MSVWVDPDYIPKSDFHNYWFTDIGTRSICCAIYAVIAFFWSYVTVVTKELRGISGITINLHCGLFFLVGPALAYPLTVPNPIPMS